MKTFGLLSIASALVVATPAFAHGGWYGPHYVAPRIAYPGHRVFIGTPIFAPRPVVVVRPAPVYYAPAPVYYGAPVAVYPAPVYPAPTAAATVGGAIAGAAIGAIASNGRPGGIAAGTVVGALVGNSLAR
jgi:hypothetical protein